MNEWRPTPPSGHASLMTSEIMVVVIIGGEGGKEGKEARDLRGEREGRGNEQEG